MISKPSPASSQVSTESSWADQVEDAERIRDLATGEHIRGLAKSLVCEGSTRVKELEGMPVDQLHALIDHIVLQADALATSTLLQADAQRFMSDLRKFLHAQNRSPDVRATIRTLCGEWCDKGLRYKTRSRGARAGRSQRPAAEETPASVSAEIKSLQMELADLSNEKRELDAKILCREAHLKGLLDKHDRLVKDRISRAGRA